ncbi:hypothetical protein GINT2_000718 [Glugoides intestinalis]
MENTENYLQQYTPLEDTIKEINEISNLEYNNNGELLSYTTNTSLKIYSMYLVPKLRNVISTTIDTMKYFQNNTLLHSKGNNIMYLSIYDNKYLRKFEGHADKINAITVNPNYDTFMSNGTDTTKLWDIRYKDPIMTLDSNGKIGAMSKDHAYALADNNFVYIFDWRNDKGPLAIKSIKPGFYCTMQYTEDGSSIVLSTLKTNLFLDSEGEFSSSFFTENECAGDILNESNIFICSSSRLLFAYKIADKKVIGKEINPELECSLIRTNPRRTQFACSSQTGVQVWNLK